MPLANEAKALRPAASIARLRILASGPKPKEVADLESAAFRITQGAPMANGDPPISCSPYPLPYGIVKLITCFEDQVEAAVSVD